MELINRRVDAYLDDLVTSDDPVLREMTAFAAERGFPIVGPQVGRLLTTLARAIGARRVLELGSGFGYSAWHFARAVGPGGQVVMSEYSAEHSERAVELLTSAGLAERVRANVGDGIALARSLVAGGETFDVVFCDAEKAEYPEAFEAASPLVRPGGLFLCDNMLWYGRVLEPDPVDRDTVGVVELCRRLFASRAFLTTLIPMRDGVTVSLRLGPEELA